MHNDMIQTALRSSYSIIKSVAPHASIAALLTIIAWNRKHDCVVCAGAVRGVTFFDNFPGLCRVLGSACIISCCTSLLSIGCISLNRYVFICRQWAYKRLYR